MALGGLLGEGCRGMLVACCARGATSQADGRETLATSFPLQKLAQLGVEWPQRPRLDDDNERQRQRRRREQKQHHHRLPVIRLICHTTRHAERFGASRTRTKRVACVDCRPPPSRLVASHGTSYCAENLLAAAVQRRLAPLLPRHILPANTVHAIDSAIVLAWHDLQIADPALRFRSSIRSAALDTNTRSLQRLAVPTDRTAAAVKNTHCSTRDPGPSLRSALICLRLSPSPLKPIIRSLPSKKGQLLRTTCSASHFLLRPLAPPAVVLDLRSFVV
jgi:hypothetical protein